MASENICVGDEDNANDEGPCFIKIEADDFEVDDEKLAQDNQEYLDFNNVLIASSLEAEETENSSNQCETNPGNDPQSGKEENKQKNSFGNGPKRVRRFQMQWKMNYPWIDYIGENDLVHGVMVCTICREYSESADLNSKFLNGTSTFRLGAIDSHNISKGHRNCVAKKLMDTMNDKSMENLLKMSEERSTQIRLRRKEREKNRKNKNLGQAGNLVNESSDQVTHVPMDSSGQLTTSVDNDNLTSQPLIPENREQPETVSDTGNHESPLKKPRMNGYESSKRKRRFLHSWKIEYPWLEYIGQSDLVNGIMVCNVCRLYPEIADQSSNFFVGTSSFRRDGIESHNISAAHRACLCRKVLDSMEEEEMESEETGHCSQTDSSGDYQPRPSDIQKMKEYFSQFGVQNNRVLENNESDYQLHLPSTSDQSKQFYENAVDHHVGENFPGVSVPQFQDRLSTMFQSGSKTSLSWVTQNQSTGEVHCKVCRLHPLVADINSELFKGTSSFNEHLIQEHLKSREHKLCVARQLYDESLTESKFQLPLHNQTFTKSMSETSKHQLPHTSSVSENQFSPVPPTEISRKAHTPMCRQYIEKRRHVFDLDRQGTGSDIGVMTNTGQYWQHMPKEQTSNFDPAWMKEFVWLDYEGTSTFMNGVMFCRLCQCYPEDAQVEFIEGSIHFNREHLVNHATSTGHRAAVCRNFLALLEEEKKFSDVKQIKVANREKIVPASDTSKEPVVVRQMIKKAASMEDFNKMRDKAKSAIDNSAAELNALSQEIWSNPELAYEEHHAHKVLTDFLEKQGFEVERKYILDTAFKATWGTDGGVTIGVICEYDALPGIGHACGHNLIAECGVATAIGIKAALEMNAVKDLNAKIVVLGTPAEEGGGGKCKMIEKGAFDGLDVAMMAHPYAHNVSRPLALSMLELTISYHGKAAHAAAAPWEGINALDAAVTCYASLSNLRQQMKPDWRIHGIITNGGAQANIIPDKAELSYYLRAPDEENLAILKEKAIACIEGAAKSTGCQAMFVFNPLTISINHNKNLCNVYEKQIQSIIVEENKDIREESNGCSIVSNGCNGANLFLESVDIGELTLNTACLFVTYTIGSEATYGTQAFYIACGAAEAQAPTLIQAKAMACTALEIAHPANESILQSIRKEFQDTVKQKQPNGSSEKEG